MFSETDKIFERSRLLQAIGTEFVACVEIQRYSNRDLSKCQHIRDKACAQLGIGCKEE